MFAGIMELNIDMFRSCMESGIFSQGDGTSIIAVDDGGGLQVT